LNEDVKKELTKMKLWGFDVFAVSQHTNYTLPVVTENALKDLQLISELELNETKLTRFLKTIQDAYLKLPYHNYLHAADVAQTSYYMCTEGNLVNAISVSKLGVLALIIGAAIHDVSHPGVTGKFITAISGPLAIQYNDQSPLENMHLSKAFTIWNDPKQNFTERMPRIMYKDLRKMIIDMVLATDNDLHFNLVAKLSDLASSGELTANRPKPAERTSEHNTRPRGLSSEAAQYTPMKPWQLLTLQITLHAADISGPAKPWDVHTKWTALVMEEFYNQGDEERKLGVPITFAFDRHNKVPLPKFQMVCKCNVIIVIIIVIIN